ncbi:uncharacterized protein si:dkey-20d21.12 [Engraulis encrasicolus]|uniref:uncharacterized protein si:dkey-20d21.12 n=1 Tax=Engraulis encrasicolus TaxID=184585 RepID=UPI002FD0A2D4
MSLMKTYSDGMLKQCPPSHPVFINDRDLTEIQLHSVESINDIHKNQTEQSRRVSFSRTPLPSFPPPSNGNMPTPVLKPAARHSKPPPIDLPKIPLPRILIFACLALLFVTLGVILFVVVKQAITVSYLSEVLLQHQGHLQDVSDLKNKLQLLQRNLSSTTPH